MKAIGYVRVSTTVQAEQGVSLENQADKIKAYCSFNDLDLVDVVVDEGISAKNLKSRPQAKTLIDRAKSEKLAVVVYKLDRMFRNTVDSIITIESLEKTGVPFHSINEKLDTGSAMGKFFMTMISAMAELERNVISERTKDALSFRKSQGKRVGNITFDYQLGDNQDLIKDPQEQKILRVIRKHHKQGLSFQKIADLLNSKGFSTRKGSPFKKQNVHQILKSSESSRVNNVN